MSDEPISLDDRIQRMKRERGWDSISFNDTARYDVWEQESVGSEYFVPICKDVGKQFAEWSMRPENCPDGLERYYTFHDAEMWKRIERSKKERRMTE